MLLFYYTYINFIIENILLKFYTNILQLHIVNLLYNTIFILLDINYCIIYFICTCNYVYISKYQTKVNLNNNNSNQKSPLANFQIVMSQKNQ